ncbi:MAG TPA: hydroxyethylthiazole kinase [Oscillospiraceae bacterium]|nr:hydroxyethylthiazole kinase [Oscillospiraceae bacterium]
MDTGKIFTALRQRQPLIHHITNQVTISECANITLAAGGLPIMAHAVEEVAEMVASADALVLNLGTLTPAQIEAMLLAGRRANELQRPIILDPVGVGATRLRSASAKKLLAALQLSVIKGNAAEIALLAGGAAKIKGVESIAVPSNVVPLAAALARETGAVVVVTGAVDLVTDGQQLLEVHNGHPLMAKVVGTGCMTASVIGCFAAVERNYLVAAAAGLAAINVAAEKAAAEADGPAMFKIKLFDQLAGLSVSTLAARQKIKNGLLEKWQ